ncbi:hypothetical protein Mpsy_0646 [Methanolobus psychrophilus R15]|nr:hypothetical protein Mpsy_0646 [Methanolobus psychrophilus R15]
MNYEITMVAKREYLKDAICSDCIFFEVDSIDGYNESGRCKKNPPQLVGHEIKTEQLDPEIAVTDSEKVKSIEAKINDFLKRNMKNPKQFKFQRSKSYWVSKYNHSSIDELGSYIQQFEPVDSDSRDFSRLERVYGNDLICIILRMILHEDASNNSDKNNSSSQAHNKLSIDECVVMYEKFFKELRGIIGADEIHLEWCGEFIRK